MGTFYRNRETGIIQAHPVSGLGEAFNSEEVGEDAKPIVSLSGKPTGTRRRAATKPKAKAEVAKTPEASAAGESNNTEGGTL